ncbi:MAG: autotransporter-associated beta strand repeat-containing protein [Akkermansia sp.]|nr:autotransporter-associated beta strand repeat-containing protein [Akkermansia sp.]
MSGESALSLSNGSWGNVYADINVDGSAKLLGSWQGNYLNVQGTINGSGTLTLGKPEGNKYNSWTISSTISDKSDTEKLSIVHTANTVTLSGNNSYSGGTTITGGTVNATHANALGTGSVTVNGGNLEITGENAIEGAELNITNGTVTATYDPNDNKSVIKHETAVKINTGGTLHLKGHDTLGYENSVAPEITLASTDSTKKATLKFEDNTSATLGATINMNGNAQIIGNKINTFGTTLTVTNKNNEVSVETIEMRTQGGIYSWDVDVAKDGELTLSSQLVAYNNENATLNKSNEGKLIVTGTESTWSGEMNVTGGTLQLQDDATLGLATVVMSSGTTLETGTGTIAALTLNAGSKLVADTAVSMDGALTLGGTITLNGGLLTALQSLEAGKTLDLFTNVSSLVLGEATYTKGTNILDATTAMDLSNWFTLTSPEVPAMLSETQPAAGSGYYLGYNADGTVYIGKVIPEPTTATLSLLALAGLAARRRRRK